MQDRPDQPAKLVTFSQATDEVIETDPPLPPTITGYTVLSLLGEGGMGTVWRAEQISTHREVALKVLHERLSGRARVRFEREVELAARLEHPGIARVYESGIHQQVYYYAMELVDGVALDTYVRTGQLNTEQILTLMQQVCAALQYAHQCGVIHRDLKPSNILVSGDGQSHILDFGLAKDLLSEQTERTVSLDGDILGTPAYMSPEQAEGIHERVDVRSDIYSLGVILYSLLTGKHPYPVDGSFLTVMDSIRSQEPQRPRAHMPGINADLEAIVLTTLAKKPEDRYQSVAELAHDLTCQAQGLPILIKSHGSLYLLRKLMARHRYTTTVVFLLLVIVLAFSGISYFMVTQLRANHRQLQSREESLEEQSRQFALLGQQVLFVNHFLPAWRQGELAKAEGLLSYFGQGSREAQAAGFLLSPLDFDKKYEIFLNPHQDKEPAFVAFIAGEQHQKDGHCDQARLAYQHCLATESIKTKDPWLLDLARSRLFVLDKQP